MHPLLSHLAAAVALLLLTAASQAEEYRVECPLSIEADALQVVKTPPSWTSAVQGPFWLHSAGPMDGPPSDMAVLKEDAYTKRIGKKTVTKWDMTGTFAVGKWMACNYGYANDFILSKRLDDRTSECTVTSTQQASGKVDIEIRCKR